MERERLKLEEQSENGSNIWFLGFVADWDWGAYELSEWRKRECPNDSGTKWKSWSLGELCNFPVFLPLFDMSLHKLRHSFPYHNYFPR